MRKLASYFGAVCVMASVLLASMLSAHAQADDRSLVGTWIATVTVPSPSGGPPFVFTDMVSFNSGGTLTITSTAFNAHTSENPFLPPPLVVDTSDGYGAWKPVGDNQFALTFKRFLFAGANTSAAIYAPVFQGQNVGVNIVAGVATVGEGGDTFTGPFTTQLVNLAGQTVFAASASASGTRLRP